MNRGIVLLSVAAMLIMAAGNAWATTSYGFIPDNSWNAWGTYPQIPNDTPGTYYQTLPYGPTATEDGLVWLNTGSGPALCAQNFALSIYYENTDSAWQWEENEFPTYALYQYPGEFIATDSVQHLGLSRYIDNPLIVGSETVPTVGLGIQTYNQGLFYLQYWTDPALASTGTSAYSSYAQASAASAAGAPGVYVAETVPFLVDFVAGMAPLGFDQRFMYMPAVVLAQATPEPSTIVLALCGLLGMLACAWRRRK